MTEPSKNKPSKYKISIDLNQIFSFIFSKKLLLPLVLLLVTYKGGQFYLYLSYSFKAEHAIIKIGDLQNLCVKNENTEKENGSYFNQQQKLATSAIESFTTSNTYQYVGLVFGRDLDDSSENLRKNMVKKSFEHCSELLKPEPEYLQVKLEKIQYKMAHRIKSFY